MTGNGRELGGCFALGPWRVRRAGYGAMQLAGDGVFGPPRDRGEALRVLRAAIAAGVDHIDTAHCPSVRGCRAPMTCGTCPDLRFTARFAHLCQGSFLVEHEVSQ